jgi:hypothetical protein
MERRKEGYFQFRIGKNRARSCGSERAIAQVGWYPVNIKHVCAFSSGAWDPLPNSEGCARV